MVETIAMTEEAARLRAQFHHFLDQRPDVTPAALAAYTSLSKSGAEAFLSHRPADADRFIGQKTLDEFRRVLSLIEAGEILQPGQRAVAVEAAASATEPDAEAQPRARNYYVTETAKQIAQVLDYCVKKRAIGVVTADYGVGKTSAVQYWRTSGRGQKTEHYVFEFDEFSRSNVADFIARLADTIGLKTNATTANTMREIVRCLASSPALLIFDQCETVAPRILQIIRQIWDGAHHAGTGIALLASPLLAERLHNPRLLKDVGALTSRVGVWVALPGIGRNEAAVILRQEGVTDIAPGAIDLLLRMTRGSMRRLMAVTDMLTVKHDGKRVTEKTIEQVAENLWGMRQIPGRRNA